MPHLVFTILGVLIAVSLNTPLYTAVILMTGCLWAAWVNREHTNLVMLCGIVIFFTLLERAAFTFIPITGTPQVWVNNRIYLTHFVFDLAALITIAYRGALFRYLYKVFNHPTRSIYLIRADLAMIGILCLFILVDLAAAIENLLRNLEHLGLSEEVAKPLWELNWVFYHYAQIKFILMGIQFLVLWSMLTPKANNKASPPAFFKV